MEVKLTLPDEIVGDGGGLDREILRKRCVEGVFCMSRIGESRPPELVGVGGWDTQVVGTEELRSKFSIFSLQGNIS